MIDVFLSYSSQDLSRARLVEQALSAAGYDVFWDQTTPAGVDWDAWIRERLALASTVIVLWSKASIASPNVRHEAIIGRDAGKLVPVMIDTLGPTDFPMGLYMVQGLKLDDWAGDVDDHRFQKLIDEVAVRTKKAPVRKSTSAPLAPAMIGIPRGRFVMGSPTDEEGRSENEGPQHAVRIAYPLSMGKFPVTFAEWDAAVEAGADLTSPNDERWGRQRRPVINVSWHDAQAYIAWLNGAFGLHGRSDRYRLPSEAEWEYACRANPEGASSAPPFSFGATISTNQANYDGTRAYGAGQKGEYRQKTTQVDAFPPNAFGLCDMHGNVLEWCDDCWNADYHGAPEDGSSWITGDVSRRVLRGGSRVGYPNRLRSANRYSADPNKRDSNFGFRLARTLDD